MELKKADKRYKRIVANERDAYQSSAVANEQALEVATKEYEERLVEREAAREAREVAANEYQQVLRQQAAASVTTDKIVVSQQQYTVQEKQRNLLPQKTSDSHVHIRQGGHSDEMIEVVGQDERIVGSLKVRTESMVARDKRDSSFWHPSFTTSSASGKDFLDHTHANKKVYTRNDFKARGLKIYGETDAKAEAPETIKEEVDRLARPKMTAAFDGNGLRKLRLCQPKDGDKVIAEHQKERDQHTCPICTKKVSHPERLGCGHSYCFDCLRRYLVSAAEALPVACITCKVPIPTPFISRFMTPQTFQALVKTAFSFCLSEPVKYCKTADSNCEQTYHRSCSDSRALKCPVCFLTICSACGEEAHDGVTCTDNKLSKDLTEQDRRFELWVAARAQRCPGCRTIDGCNHITCEQCQTHFCRKCGFNGDEVYVHVDQKHSDVDDSLGL